MNKYTIKSIAFTALYSMAILNSGAASCAKETKLTELTEEELKKRMTETQEELKRRESSENEPSKKENENDK